MIGTILKDEVIIIMHMKIPSSMKVIIITKQHNSLIIEMEMLLTIRQSKST